MFVERESGGLGRGTIIAGEGENVARIEALDHPAPQDRRQSEEPSAPVRLPAKIAKVPTQQATVERIGRQITAQQASVVQAQAQLTSAQAGATRTRLELDRQQSLAQRDFASRQTLEQAQANRDQAVAGVQSAQAAV